MIDDAPTGSDNRANHGVVCLLQRLCLFRAVSLSGAGADERIVSGSRMLFGVGARREESIEISV
jgi:hypothetical protein